MYIIFYLQKVCNYFLAIYNCVLFIFIDFFVLIVNHQIKRVSSLSKSILLQRLNISLCPFVGAGCDGNDQEPEPGLEEPLLYWSVHGRLHSLLAVCSGTSSLLDPDPDFFF